MALALCLLLAGCIANPIVVPLAEQPLVIGRQTVALAVVKPLALLDDNMVCLVIEHAKEWNGTAIENAYEAAVGSKRLQDNPMTVELVDVNGDRQQMSGFSRGAGHYVSKDRVDIIMCRELCPDKNSSRAPIARVEVSSPIEISAEAVLWIARPKP